MSTEIPAPAAPAVLPRFNVSPYRPDGGFAMSGVTLLLSALAIAGAILGYLAHLVSAYIYLIIMFPILIGLGLGVIGTRMIKQGRVRNPLFGGLAGFLGGVLAMAMMHYFDFEKFKAQQPPLSQLPPKIAEVAQLPTAQRTQWIQANVPAEDREDLDNALRSVNVKTLFDYMDLSARYGVEIKRTTGSSKDKGLNLGYTGTYIYWMVEVLIVALVTWGMLKSAAAEPYCAPCDQWKEQKVLGVLPGSQAAGMAVASGNLGAMAALDPHGQGIVRVTAACCKGCVGKGHIDVKAELITADRKGKEKTQTVAHVSYPPEAMVPLQQFFAPPPPAADEPANPPSAG